MDHYYVPDYLTGRKAIYHYTEDAVTVGGDNEADCYAEEYINQRLEDCARGY